MKNEYNGGLTREQFLFYEIRTVASLCLQGYSKDEIVERIREVPDHRGKGKRDHCRPDRIHNRYSVCQ